VRARRRSPWIVVGPALVALLVGIASCSGGRGTSGVRGVIVAGPQCPVEQLGSPCPDQPFPGTVRATALDGSVVAEVESDGEGRFRMPLDPGSYVLAVVIAGGGPPTATPQPVRVDEGRFTSVTLRVDTGIR
jgi:hypothetical protein